MKIADCNGMEQKCGQSSGEGDVFMTKGKKFRKGKDRVEEQSINEQKAAFTDGRKATWSEHKYST